MLSSRGSDEEFGYFNRSLSSAFRLNPDEVVLCFDKPSPKKFVDVAHRIHTHFVDRGFGTDLKIVEVERTPDWGFHQFKVHREGYRAARNDIILAYDVDNVLYPRILKGLRYVGADNCAVVSFNKFLYISGLPSYMRASYYHIKRAGYGAYARFRHRPFRMFTGVYWLYRPWYFEVMSEEICKPLLNSEDGLLLDRFSHGEVFGHGYSIRLMSDIGSRCLNHSDADKPWRQMQDGVWIGANGHFESLDGSIKKRGGLGGAVMKSFILGHPLILKGYVWARNNPNAPAVKQARAESLYDFCYHGKKFFPSVAS